MAAMTSSESTNTNENAEIAAGQMKSPSYPSNCLRFLKETSTNPEIGCTASSGQSLNVIIVGAGLCGLATAIALARRNHHVTICEQAERLAEVGAGIQIPPNSSRLLFKLGLEPYLKPYVTEPESVLIRRWQNGNIIGRTQYVPEFQAEYGAPYYLIHRAHFHEAMYKLAIELSVTVKLGARVVSYNEASVTLQNGTTLNADLIVAADGLKSTARSQLFAGSDQKPQYTGLAAYRATVDVDRIKADPEVSWLLDRPCLNLWIGDRRHIMSYSISSGKVFNLVLNCPDASDPAHWTQETALEDMKSEYEGWDPSLVKIIGMVDKTVKWPLFSKSILPRWVSGKLVIIGDAAHAMMPYMSQGAAIAVEDGVALARALDHISSTDQIPLALSVFQTVRLQRATQMQDASLLNSILWHFADGPLQEARDAAMRPEVEGRPFVHSPNQWSDPATQIWCYGYDTERAIDEEWSKRWDKAASLA